MVTEPRGNPEAVSLDSTPKWFTQVDLSEIERWTESTIHYLPTIEYDETQFTRVVFDTEVSSIRLPSADE